MEIKQFYDKNLAHASYAILSENEIALIDPARNPKQYYDFARENNARIVAVIETHPHADFVSSHLEVSKSTGAKIYVSKLLNPHYDFIPFDEGDFLKLGKITLNAINTPGHSPDSISILIKDESGKDYALATGDTLFVGDVGRPDLRESAGSIQKKKEELAKMMYKTINEKLLKMSDNVLVYPAHGAGSLCGKTSSADTFTTIGRERNSNYALKQMTENEFVNVLLKDQPFIPKYFGYDVEMNRKGAENFEESIAKVKKINSYDDIENQYPVVDARSKTQFAEGHFPGSFNILNNTKFETWLGAIVSPSEKFYLVSDTNESLNDLIGRTAAIGYESNIAGALVHSDNGILVKSGEMNFEKFRKNPSSYTIVDIRLNSESDGRKIFKDSFPIPLNELREKVNDLPGDKPVVVHCQVGTRSAIGRSILEKKFGTQVFDLGEHILEFT